MSWLKKYKYRIIGATVGLVIGILFLAIGFWKTMLLILLSALGYMAGSIVDNNGVLDKYKGIFKSKDGDNNII